MPYDRVIAEKVIRKLRREKGITQETLSGLSGIARRHLAMIETGAKTANVEMLWKIAEALGMPLSRLIEKIEAETK